jgi:DNA-binding NtrC family response regulator
MIQQLAQAKYDAVFCSRTLSSGSWGEALKQVRQGYPDVPVIILSHTADEKEWAEVLAAGAFDLLGLPCYERTLLSVMEHAVATREARAWHPISRLQTA